MNRTFRATMLAGVSLCALLGAGTGGSRSNPPTNAPTARRRWPMPGR